MVLLYGAFDLGLYCHARQWGPEAWIPGKVLPLPNTEWLIMPEHCVYELWFAVNTCLTSGNLEYGYILSPQFKKKSLK